VGAPRKYDAKVVEQEYVTGQDSIRGLAAKHGISFSTLAAQARKDDWKGRRIAYQSSLSRRGYETMAAQVAGAEAAIREESIAVLRATLRVYAQRLTNGEVPVSTKDAVETIRQLAVLLGEPEGGSRDEPYNVTGTDRAKPDADFLRRAIEAARGRLAAGGVLEGPPAGKPSGTRSN
jgi:hypothetical protein